MVGTRIKLGATIILWAAIVVGSLLLSPVSGIFIGVAVGSILTALLLGISVRWGIKLLSENMFSSVDTLSENLAETAPEIDDLQQD